jgi:Zn-dependent protease with chaperone function
MLPPPASWSAGLVRGWPTASTSACSGTVEAAVFFDGLSSRRHVVRLSFADRLEIITVEAPDTALLASWPYDAVRRVDGPASALRVSCTTAPPLARLELRDPSARANILRLCPALDGPGGAGTVSVWRIAVASLAAGVTIIAIAWFGMPLLANRLAEMMPYSWEKPLGEAVDGQARTLFSGHACESAPGIAALKKLVGQLQEVADLPIAPDPVVLQSGVPNAFALPGGRVYVLSELLNVSQMPDELAGVLAHEFGHVAHRDGLRRVIRDGGTSFLIGLMFGDVTGAGAVLMAGRTVLSAAYSRPDEERADAFAVSVMHRLGRPAAPLGSLLQRITGSADDMVPSILNDHPLTTDRNARLEAEDIPPTGPALLDASEWQSLKHICNR